MYIYKEALHKAKSRMIEADPVAAASQTTGYSLHHLFNAQNKADTVLPDHHTPPSSQ